MDSVFYADKISNAFMLSKDELHHMDVLRIQLPSYIMFTDGNGKLYRGMADENGNICNYNEIDAREPENVNIFYGICDRNRERIMLEKCTELGIKSFNPIITEQSEQFTINAERAGKIIVSAVKQSRRFHIPAYNEKRQMTDIIDNGIENGVYGSLDGSSELKILPGIDVNVFIGPPSGFSVDEEQMMESAGIMPFHINSAIMRTETFAIAVLSVIKYLQGV